MPNDELIDGSVEELCTAIEGYFQTLRDAGVELSEEVLEPQSDKQIATLEKKLAVELPPDLRAFLRRGLQGATASFEEGDSFRNPPLRVAASFHAFLRDWLASGCFGSHSFDLAWKHVKEHLPLAIPPSKNAWVKAYKKQFPSL